MASSGSWRQALRAGGQGLGRGLFTQACSCAHGAQRGDSAWLPTEGQRNGGGDLQT